MGRLMWFVGANVGGAFGWWLGSAAGLFAAVALSALGTGVGIYAGHRIARDYFA